MLHAAHLVRIPSLVVSHCKTSHAGKADLLCFWAGGLQECNGSLIRSTNCMALKSRGARKADKEKACRLSLTCPQPDGSMRRPFFSWRIAF